MLKYIRNPSNPSTRWEGLSTDQGYSIYPHHMKFTYSRIIINKQTLKVNENVNIFSSLVTLSAYIGKKERNYLDIYKSAYKTFWSH